MKVIPNQNTWVGFSPTLPDPLTAPTAAEIAGAEDVTCFLVSLTANAQGNTVPTPSICTLFETSVPGTSTATFTADFYRDDDDDVAWDLFPRGTSGVFYISRFGGTGAAHMPVATNKLEVWPVQITSRSAGPLASNTAQVFTITASVPTEPAEDAVVAA